MADRQCVMDGNEIYTVYKMNNTNDFYVFTIFIELC